MKKIILSLIVIINISSFKSVSQDLKIGYTNVEYILTFLPSIKQINNSKEVIFHVLMIELVTT